MDKVSIASACNPADAAEHTDACSTPLVSLDDLLSFQSDALNRIARDVEDDSVVTAHNSLSSGHRSGGSHNSHSSQSQIEYPLA